MIVFISACVLSPSPFFLWDRSPRPGSEPPGCFQCGEHSASQADMTAGVVPGWGLPLVLWAWGSMMGLTTCLSLGTFPQPPCPDRSQTVSWHPRPWPSHSPAATRGKPVQLATVTALETCTGVASTRTARLCFTICWFFPAENRPFTAVTWEADSLPQLPPSEWLTVLGGAGVWVSRQVQGSWPTCGTLGPLHPLEGYRTFLGTRVSEWKEKK